MPRLFILVFLILILSLFYGCKQNVSQPTPTPATPVITVAPSSIPATTAPAITTTATTTTTPAPTAPVASPPVLADVLKGKYVTARFFGLMTLDYRGAPVVYPTELVIASVPVVWSGLSFSGKIEEVGSGEDVTDLVSGAISADGSRILTLTYSRRVMRKDNTGLFYQVRLTGLPLNNGGLPAVPGRFAQTGNIQSFFTSVEYTDGTIDAAGNIVPSTRYVSTDWLNTGTGQAPSLTAAIEIEPSQTRIINPVNQ